MKIVFFGTPDFAATILEKLVKNNFKPVLVVTSQDKPIGRRQELTPPSVKIEAQKYGLPVLQPESFDIPEFRQVLFNSQPDFIVLAAFGPPFLDKKILNIPKYGCLNVHPSLLPKYRGASPIPQAILNGEKETGVTIIRMSEKIDQGDILSQEKLEILPVDTALTLTNKLAGLGGSLLVKTISALVGSGIFPRPQGESPTPYCPQLKKEDGRINWDCPADYIERQTRAFDPWPGTYTFFEKKILKILKTHVITDRMSDISSHAINENEPERKAGFVFLTRDGKLAVQAQKGSLVVEILQLEGKKPVPVQDFLRGHRDIVGATLE
ncbi:MAG: methionyl-tRNA formyltransferase [bacterium]|nr:methionyl-tRNA formyltransferase [bacterium]